MWFSPHFESLEKPCGTVHLAIINRSLVEIKKRIRYEKLSRRVRFFVVKKLIKGAAYAAPFISSINYRNILT